MDAGPSMTINLGPFPALSKEVDSTTGRIIPFDFPSSSYDDSQEDNSEARTDDEMQVQDELEDWLDAILQDPQ